MSEGAGDGPGLTGPGSQTSGTEEHETAEANAGSPTATAAGGSSPSDSEGASVRGVPPVDTAVFAISGVVTLFTLAGTMLL